MRLPVRTIITATLVFCLSLWATNLRGQTATTGTIEGTVTDINGAAMPSVVVTVTSPNFSSSFRAQSGIPFNQLIPHFLYGNNEGFGVPRGTATVPSGVPGGVKAGENRTPTTFQLDLGAYYPIKLAENRQLRIQVDWFNLANAQRAIRLDETFTTTSGIPGAAFIEFPNPFYGQGTIFQFPSSLRLGLKFQF